MLRNHYQQRHAITHVVSGGVEADSLSVAVKAGIGSIVGVVGMVLVAGFSIQRFAWVVAPDQHQHQGREDESSDNLQLYKHSEDYDTCIGFKLIA